MYPSVSVKTIWLVSLVRIPRISDRVVCVAGRCVDRCGTPEEIFSRPKELREMGLDIPGAAALSEELRQRGVELPGSIYTPEQLAQALLARRGGAPC